jgi:plasmid maintenance system antidote protein VapI
MKTTETFRPDWALPPGVTIIALLRERQLSIEEFASKIEQSIEDVQALLQGRSTITLALARRLSAVLGASIEFWMARDYRYRDTIARLQSAEEKWLSELPLKDMVKYGWLNARPSEEVGACLRFFGVPSVAAWRASYESLLSATAFRTSKAFESKPGAVAAWLRAGELEAATIDCNPWDADRFRESLSKIRPLTRQKDPERFIPKLKAQCAENGVAVVIVRAPDGCRASGATRFITVQKAILQLSFRFRSDDQFWFTFFHEVGHLLLHGHGRLFLEGIGTPPTAQEEEASAFAARTLIPVDEEKALLKLRPSHQSVLRFATRLGIAPGIIVGQLQHHGLRKDYLNDLKRRFEWEEYTSITRGKT